MHAGCVEPIFAAVLADDPSRITAAAAAQRMDEDLFAPSGATGTAGASELQLEIVRLLLAAGATLADVDRDGVPVADRIPKARPCAAR